MDRMGADFYNVLNMIKDRLSANPVPIVLPIGASETFTGLVDLIGNEAIVYNVDDGTSFESVPIPEDMKELSEKWRKNLIEEVASYDEELLEKYIGGEELSIDEIKFAIRKACIDGSMIPTLCGSAFKNKGVQRVLDSVIDYLPSPLDKGAVVGSLKHDPDQVIERSPDDSEPFAALAFKIMTDPFVGRLTFFRVYSGKISTGDFVYNATSDGKSRVGRLMLMHADKREERSSVSTGEIAAVVGLKQVRTGDTLCSVDKPILLESLEFPEPVISVSVEPLSKSDQENLTTGLVKLAEEDPTFTVKTNEETAQTIISGMGELHLEIIVDRLKREFNVGVHTGSPQVAYKESITESISDVHGKFVKQSGGRGQYGHVVINLEPSEPGKGFTFNNKITGGSIPREYINPVSSGIEEAMKNGVLAGYPLEDLEVSLIDGSYHDVDSSEIAFKIAGSMAFAEAVKQASPAILEPMMSLEVVMPEEYLGAVMGDVTSRRGNIQGTTQRKDAHVLNCEIPLSSVFGYATDLRSMTSGRALFTMQFSHYEKTPKFIQEKIIEKYQGKAVV